MIVDIPEARRAAGATDFQLRSPDIFGEIVNRVLKREHEEKFLPGWRSQGLDQHLVGVWKDPFGPDSQRRILRDLVLAAARDGGAEAIRHAPDDPRYQRLRHGLFAFGHQSSQPVGPQGDNADASAVILGEIVQTVLGEPATEPHVPESEADAIRRQAVDEVVAALRSHTLADTQPRPPESLVFATRHRAYFDYLLAEAVLEEMVSPPHGGAVRIDENFVLWCLEHNIVEHGEGGEAPPFASCLDFVLWHRKSLAKAVAAAEEYLSLPSDTEGFSEELASYLCSFGLALLLRYSQLRGGVVLPGIDTASQRGCTIRILPDLVPTISQLRVESCHFPRLALHDVDLDKVAIVDTILGALEVGNSTWRGVEVAVDVNALLFHGRVELDDCTLEIQCPDDVPIEIEWTPATRLSLRRCRLNVELYDSLREAAQISGGAIQLVECAPIEYEERVRYSPGRQFVNRLVNLARKHGHAEYAVFREKLKGRSRATTVSFTEMLAILAQKGVIESPNDQMIRLTPAGEKARFSGKAAPGQRSYEDVAEFWGPIVELLDEALARKQ